MMRPGLGLDRPPTWVVSSGPPGPAARSCPAVPSSRLPLGLSHQWEGAGPQGSGTGEPGDPRPFLPASGRADGRGGGPRDSRPPASGPAPPAGSAPPRQPGHRDAAPVGEGKRQMAKEVWRLSHHPPTRPRGPRPSPHGSASPCPRRARPAGGKRPPRPSGPPRAVGSSRPHPGARGHSQPGGAAWGPDRLRVKGQEKGLGQGLWWQHQL